MYYKNQPIGLKVMISTMRDESLFFLVKREEGKRIKVEKLILQLTFFTYLRAYLLKFDQERSSDGEFNYASNEYPLDILLIDQIVSKLRNT